MKPTQVGFTLPEDKLKRSKKNSKHFKCVEFFFWTIIKVENLF